MIICEYCNQEIKLNHSKKYDETEKKVYHFNCELLQSKRQEEQQVNQTYYAIAINGINGEEYMRETNGDDCFTDDIGHALLYEFVGEIPPLANDIEYIVKVRDDDGLTVIGKLSEEKPITI